MEFEPLSLGNEVIEFDMIGLGYEATIDMEHPIEDDEDLVNIDYSSAAANSVLAAGVGPHIFGGDTNLEPCQGMDFESEEAAKAFYNSYARRVGFSTRVSMSRRSRRDGSIIQRSFVCAKEGFRVEKEKHLVDGRVKRPRAETRVGCKAMLVVKIQDSGRWVVSSFVKEHNHELVPPDKVHCLRSHRHVSGPAKSLIDTLQSAGIGPSGIMSALIQEYGGISNIGFTERDCRNYMRSSRQRTLGESIEEFESCWSCLIDRYDLKKHEWLQAIYGDRGHWALKYVDEGVTSSEVYDVAISALREAANKVAFATKNGGRQVILNGTCEEDLHQSNEATIRRSDSPFGTQQSPYKDDQDRTIEKLTRQLDRARRKCEVYRSNLLSILKDIEEQKLQLSVKVQNIKLGMKE
ncbi:hypothetical protein VNO80_09173 [Phaseolus coccineus]|uniref:FAR1 domain-containing protein n=1 Tax=Phaseolus coccineus TaxID=3886 RepID=A0AAN9NB44_PHACN